VKRYTNMTETPRAANTNETVVRLGERAAERGESG
jgi:hypothetical protein